MKNIFILFIALFACTQMAKCNHQIKTNDVRFANEIDSLKHEISIRDSVIHAADKVIENNNLWDIDGSDDMAFYLKKYDKLYHGGK